MALEVGHAALFAARFTNLFVSSSLGSRNVTFIIERHSGLCVARVEAVRLIDHVVQQLRLVVDCSACIFASRRCP